MSQGYGSREYWEARYAKGGEPEEWLQSFAVLRPLLERAVPFAASLLVLGCGSSRLDEEMRDAGWARVTSIDYAHAALAGRTPAPGLSYLIMDARQLGFAAGSLDAVVDKGTLDALACIADDGLALGEACGELARALAPGGMLFSVSFSPPRVRQALLEKTLGGPVEVASVPKKRMVEGLDPELSVNWVYLAQRRA